MKSRHWWSFRASATREGRKTRHWSSFRSRGWSGLRGVEPEGSTRLAAEGALGLDRAVGVLGGRLVVDVRLALTALFRLQCFAKLPLGLVLRRRPRRNLLLGSHFLSLLFGPQ